MESDFQRRSNHKTVYKVGTSFLKGLIPATLVAMIVESMVHFPALTWLGSVTFTGQIKQLPILIVGILV
ncbi:hypothetical protein P7H00_03050 [Enterococcus pseudoavium]|uniref:Uncharacterized protein n=1 Tax=Enterococcus pseudoavium TaxID=44007 RepID=A0AAE4L2T9_9ENTE|nr:hypothetical protein [Enterococcus pseudoavium]MDT2736114.1 hypothetical protein [Enterococcus pseudoavium]